MVAIDFYPFPFCIMSRKYVTLLAASALLLAACGRSAPTDDAASSSSMSSLDAAAVSSSSVAVAAGAQTWTDADGTMLRYNADTKLLEGSVDGTTFVEVPGNMWKGSDKNWYKFTDAGMVEMSADQGQTWKPVTSWKSSGSTFTVQNGVVSMMTGEVDSAPADTQGMSAAAVSSTQAR